MVVIAAEAVCQITSNAHKFMIIITIIMNDLIITTIMISLIILISIMVTIIIIRFREACYPTSSLLLLLSLLSLLLLLLSLLLLSLLLLSLLLDFGENNITLIIYSLVLYLL